MEVKCRIRTQTDQGYTIPASANTQSLRKKIVVPSDSKTLIGFSRQCVRRQSFLVRPFLLIGPERAFSEMPVNPKMLHADIARREL
jgi:hypothetical protein